MALSRICVGTVFVGSATVAAIGVLTACAADVGPGRRGGDLATMDSWDPPAKGLCVVGTLDEMRVFEEALATLSRLEGSPDVVIPEIPPYVVADCASHPHRLTGAPWEREPVAGLPLSPIRRAAQSAQKLFLSSKTKQVVMQGAFGCKMECRISYKVAREHIPEIFGGLLLDDLARTSVTTSKGAFRSLEDFNSAMADIFRLRGNPNGADALAQYLEAYFQRLGWSGRAKPGRSLHALVELADHLSAPQRNALVELPLDASGKAFTHFSERASALSEKYLRLVEHIGRAAPEEGWLKLITNGRSAAQNQVSKTIKNLSIQTPSGTGAPGSFFLEESSSGSVRMAVERLEDETLQTAIQWLEQRLRSAPARATHELDLPGSVEQLEDLLQVIIDVARL